VFSFRNWSYWEKDEGKSWLLLTKAIVFFPVSGLVAQPEIINTAAKTAYIFFIQFIILENRKITSGKN
jgi:hypothetical protein